MDLGPHAAYILGAYGFAALVLTGMILAAWRDNRAQRRALAALRDERHGDRA